VAPETFYIDVPLSTKPHRLACHHWPNHSASETVLCVHGLTRNGRDFDFLAESLLEKFEILAPDMPGRGNSDLLPAPLYNYQTYLFDIQSLLANRGLKSVRWIGTSMGGIIGMMMASANPGMIQSLVLNDVGCTISANGLKRIMQYAGLRSLFATRAEAEAEIHARCKPFGITGEYHWQHLYEHGVRECPDGKFALHYDPAIINGLQLPEPLSDIDLWPLWEQVKPIPVLLIRGVDSDLLFETVLKWLSRSLEGEVTT